MKGLQQFVSCCFAVFLWVGVCSMAWAVDLNSASREQLVSIKGIGLKTAENIIRERQRGGPFLSRQDLSLRVKGIGVKKANKLFDAGLQIKGGSLPGKSVDNAVHQVWPVNKKEKQRPISAAEPKLIKPRAGNAE